MSYFLFVLGHFLGEPLLHAPTPGHGLHLTQSFLLWIKLSPKGQYIHLITHLEYLFDMLWHPSDYSMRHMLDR